MCLSKPCVQSHLGQLATATPLGQIIYYDLIVHVRARAADICTPDVFCSFKECGKESVRMFTSNVNFKKKNFYVLDQDWFFWTITQQRNTSIDHSGFAERMSCPSPTTVSTAVTADRNIFLCLSAPSVVWQKRSELNRRKRPTSKKYVVVEFKLEVRRSISRRLLSQNGPIRRFNQTLQSYTVSFLSSMIVLLFISACLSLSLRAPWGIFSFDLYRQCQNPFFSIKTELVLVDLLRENAEVVNNSVCFLFIKSISRRSTNHFPPISHSGRPNGISEACDFTPVSTPGYLRDSQKAVIITRASFKTAGRR